MADRDDSSPSEELLKQAGATADDYELTSPIDDLYEDASDRDEPEGTRLSAEEIAAALAAARGDREPEEPPPPPPDPQPVAPYDSYSPSPSSDGDQDPWSTPSGEWERVEAEREAKRSGRLGGRMPRFNIGALIGIGFVVVFVVGLLISFFDGKEAIQNQTVGDCFIAGDAEELAEVEVVDCSEPHDNEVFAVINAAVLGSSYPGEDPLFNWMFDQCLGHFEDYTGQSFEESTWFFDTLIPTAEGWREGDKEGLCTIVAVDEQLNIRTVSGSARNSGSQS